MDRLGTCMDARSNDPDRAALVEGHIEAYLATETVSVWHAVETLKDPPSFVEAASSAGVAPTVARRPINVKPLPFSSGRVGRSITVPMAQRRLTHNEMHRLGPCLTALRVLAKSTGPHRDVLIERHIDDYLKTDPFSLAHALERLRRAIHYEELERRGGEDWSVAKNYVRLLLHRMT
jgi:hypothetical protein